MEGHNISFLKRISNAIRPTGYAKALKPTHENRGETPRVSFKTQIDAYRKDVALRDFVDVLAMQSVGMGFYTTCATKDAYPRAEDAKKIVDDFNETCDLDDQLQVLSRELIATGNAVLQLFEPDQIKLVRRVPIVSFDRIFTNEFLELTTTDFTKNRNIKLGLKQTSEYGGETISPERLLLFRWNPIDDSGWGCGLVQAMMEPYSWQEWDTNSRQYTTRTRPSLLEIKAKLDSDLIEIFEKFAGPIEAWIAENHKLAQSLEKELLGTPKYGGRLVTSGKLEIKTPPWEARGRFEGIVEYLWNQFCLGGQTPLPKLLTTPGFTEASANSAIEIADRLIMPVQRLFKRNVEKLWRWVITDTDKTLDPKAAGVRLNWGAPETPEIAMADLVNAAARGIIRPEEFRKNAVKFGWELWNAPKSSESQEGSKATEEVTA